jgi:hypothetical protein
VPPRSEGPKPPRSTAPERMATVQPSNRPSLSSGEIDLITEIVMGMQESIGKLTEAVDTLKKQSEKHGDKLDSIGKDMYAAKVILGLVGAGIVIGAGWLGIVIKGLVDHLASHPK